MDLADRIAQEFKSAEERGYHRGVQETAQMFIADAVEMREAIRPFAKAVESIGKRPDDQHWLGFSIRDWRRLAMFNEAINEPK